MFISRLSLLFICLAALAFSACSNDDPITAAKFTNVASTTAQAGAATTVTAPAGSALAGASAMLAADVLPAGGKLGISTAPAQSINDEAFARIGSTVRFYATDASGALVADFGANMATVTIPFDQAQLTADETAEPMGELLLFRSADDDTTPESIAFTMGTGMVTAQTNHFSMFYLMRRRTAVNGVKVTSVTPNTGPETGGTALTVFGQGFVGSVSVMIGGNAATNVEVKSAQYLTCKTGAGSVGAADLVVQSPFGSASLSMGFTYEAVPVMPTISGLSPDNSLLAGGSVLIFGGGFSQGPITVAFGGNAATGVSVASDSELSCIAPAASTAGAVDVVLTNANGTASLTGGFTYTNAPLPTILSITPASQVGLTGGGSFTVTGTGFSSAPTTITIGGVDGNASVLSDSMLVGQIPTGSATGSVDVVVTTANGSATLTDGFSYNDAAAPVGTWLPVETSGRPPVRNGHGMVQASGTVYIFGGQSGNTYYNDLWSYDASNDTFTELTTTGDVPSPRAYHGMTSWYDSSISNSKIAVFGGSTPTPPGTGAVLNLATMTWTAMSTVNASHARLNISVHHVGNNKLFVWGGENLGAQSQPESGSIYDVENDSWSAISSVNAPSPRNNVHTFLDWDNKTIYVFGGVDQAGNYFNELYAYDVANDTWSMRSNTNAPSGRTSAGTVALSGKLFIFGGVNSSGFLSDGGIYDIATDTWTATSADNAPSPRSHMVCILTGNGIVVWAGNGLAQPRDGAVYDRNTDTWAPIDVSSANTPEWTYEGKGVYVGRVVVFGGRDNGLYGTNTVGCLVFN